MMVIAAIHSHFASVNCGLVFDFEAELMRG